MPLHDPDLGGDDRLWILENPPVYGQAVWNRTGRPRALGPRVVPVVRVVVRTLGVVSNAPAHAALVDEATFRSVQGIRAGRKAQDGGPERIFSRGLRVCGAW